MNVYFRLMKCTLCCNFALLFSVSEFINHQTTKLRPLIEIDAKVTDDEVLKLGKKDADK